MKILVIDDELQILTLSEVFLSNAGNHIVLASSGSEGLKQFDIQSPEYFDIILTDLDCAKGDGIDGFALMRHVRKSNQDIPLVCMSGNPSHEVPAREITPYFIKKPFKFPRLSQYLADVFVNHIRMHSEMGS